MISVKSSTQAPFVIVIFTDIPIIIMAIVSVVVMVAVGVTVQIYTSTSRVLLIF